MRTRMAARERELSNQAYKVLIQIFMEFMTWNVTHTHEHMHVDDARRGWGCFANVLHEPLIEIWPNVLSHFMSTDKMISKDANKSPIRWQFATTENGENKWIGSKHIHKLTCALFTHHEIYFSHARLNACYFSHRPHICYPHTLPSIHDGPEER